MRIRWSDRARQQVVEIFQYIARDRPNAAEDLVFAFFERVELLAEFPEQGEPWGDGTRPDLRQLVHKSHRIVYRVDPGEISVLSVRHTRMEMDEEV
ncbi:MAG TPA: type II toxin-antitoxin system RelE/ParE family toxin [Polyangiales bacterium]|nr:type II toxin-antitoxin system RelE/ParE family toxin [Polyangiales bacterium]